MIPLLIFLAVLAVLTLVVLATRAPSLEERSKHKRTQRHYREAVVLLERSMSDPFFQTTDDFKDQATAVVDRYYKEN